MVNPPVRGDPSQQRIGAWVFGSLILVFYMLIYLYPRGALPTWRHQQLGIISAILVGLFGYFISGDIATNAKVPASSGQAVVVRATGGCGLFVLALFYWWKTGGPIPSSEQVAADLKQQVESTARAIPTDTVRRTGAISTSANVRELARTLAESDPRYHDVLPLQNPVVPVEALSRAAATLGDSGSARNTANVALLQSTFGSGIGPFKFGMTPEDVNVRLARPLADVSWQRLPVASEYRTAEVRYFWIPLSEFSGEGPQASFRQPLQALTPCWGGQSYVTFLFTQGRLTRISVRLYPDCANRVQLLRQLAQSYGITSFDQTGPIAFQVVLATATVAGQISRDAASLDVFSSGSLQA